MTSILMEDEKLAYQMTCRLIEAGHTKIMGCFKYDDVQGVKRYLGYAKAMTEHGLPYENDFVFWFGGFQVGFSDVFETYASTPVFEDICRKAQEATALVCFNDLIAAGIIQRLNKMEYSVPDDISIVSFDDDIIQKEKSICLVSAKHPKEVLGHRAAKEILKQIARALDPVAEEKIYIPSEIAERNSIKVLNRK